MNDSLEFSAQLKTGNEKPRAGICRPAMCGVVVSDTQRAESKTLNMFCSDTMYV